MPGQALQLIKMLTLVVLLDAPAGRFLPETVNTFNQMAGWVIMTSEASVGRTGGRVVGNRKAVMRQRPVGEKGQ